MSASMKIMATKNYRLFTSCAENRPLVPQKHKRLKQSMEKYGFLPCYPVACVRDAKGRLVIIDGQHRRAMAELLGIAIYYIVMESMFDIPTVNCTQEKWTPRNFAECYAAKGNKEYIAGLEFCDKHGISVGTGFGLLAGTTSWNNCATEYYGGTFVAKDKPYAETVASIYSRLVHEAPAIKNARLLEACMMVARVDGFDVQRLYGGIERCRDKLVAYSTRDAYLDMLETIGLTRVAQRRPSL
jgi:hypothetical protein